MLFPNSPLYLGLIVALRANVVLKEVLRVGTLVFSSATPPLWRLLPARARGAPLTIAGTPGLPAHEAPRSQEMANISF